MIPVEYITEEEIGKRFDILPPKLQEALNSDQSLNVVNDICARNHIADQEKVLIFQQIVSLIMLGFVHYYDASQEINEALSLDNPKFAAAIADELIAKIFNPLKTELESAYQPIIIPKSDSIPEASSAGPKILDETSSGVPTPPAPTQIFPQTFGLGSTAGTPLSDKGWSTLRASVVAGKNQPPAPMPAPVPMASQNLAAQPIPKSMPPPAPSMLVQRADVPKPIKNAPDFHAPMSTENVMTGKQSVPIPVKPVVLEMAGMPRPAIGKNPGTLQNPPSSTALNASDAASAKTIHYGGLTSSLPVQLPTTRSKPVPETGRSVVEITAKDQNPMAAVTPSLIKPAPMSNQTPIPTMSTPKPQAVPMPKPVIPTPAAISQQNVPRPAPAAPPKPMPQQMPGGNVIVKDFTA